MPVESWWKNWDFLGVLFLFAIAAVRGEDFRREDWRDGGVEVGMGFEAAWERFRGVV